MRVNPTTDLLDLVTEHLSIRPGNCRLVNHMFNIGIICFRQAALEVRLSKSFIILTCIPSFSAFPYLARSPFRSFRVLTLFRAMLQILISLRCVGRSHHHDLDRGPCIHVRI